MITRRHFLRRMTQAGTVGMVGLNPRYAASEPPAETTRIRLPKYAYDVACTAPQWMAEELLHAEGFSTVEYVPTEDHNEALAANKLDMALSAVQGLILSIEAGKALTVLMGIHSGCFELFANDRVRSIRDLKGKTVAVSSPARRAFVMSMAGYVGLNPRTEIAFVTPAPTAAIELLADGKVDAFLGFPPEPQELRARQIGHVVVNTTLDRPWSQYFCCMAVGNKAFVRKHPAATKRALRALLKATEACSANPEHVARVLVGKGYLRHYDYSLQALKEIPYGQWRDYDSADTMRFHALRMREVGAITSSPQRILADGVDWRFVNELKKELKG
jgi:NitT/TauT family transport system substrate-binding protein